MGWPIGIDSNVSPTSVVSFNVGGQSFATAASTLMREPDSMLSRMVESEIKSAVDAEGKIFIDRDPKHFRIILNFLRDGTCAVPEEEAEVYELLREIDYYQLESMRNFILGEEDSAPLSASHLRFCIINKLQADPQLQRVIGLIIEAAYGASRLHDIPTRKARVDVSVKETASNPIGTASKFPDMHRSKDEQLYCYFLQDMQFQGKGARYDFMHKHEPALIYEDYNAYDPKVYGGEYHDRKHIKMMDVYRHLCIHSISGWTKRVREAAVFIVENPEAVQWGLELEGYRDVRLHFRRRDLESYDPDETPPSSPRTDGPVLCHIAFEIHLSL